MAKYILDKPSKRNVFIVIIKADSNDGDYVTNTDKFNKEDFEEYGLDALVDLKENYGGLHELSDYHNDYDLSIPYNGYDGFCHTLTELKIQYIDEDGVTWDVYI